MSGKVAITAVAVTISAGLAPVVTIAATGFFAPRKVNPSDKLSLYGSATVADLPGRPGSGALAATAMTYEWSTTPQVTLALALAPAPAPALALAHALDLTLGGAPRLAAYRPRAG